jgi:hypothetical protein
MLMIPQTRWSPAINLFFKVNLRPIPGGKYLIAGYHVRNDSILVDWAWFVIPADKPETDGEVS